MNNLKLKLKKVDAIKYGVVTGATMALLVFIILVIAFIFTSLFGLGAAVAATESNASYGLGALFGGGIFMLILAPILYFIFGFIFGWIGALLLNFILKKTDGLNLEFEKTELNINQIGNE